MNMKRIMIPIFILTSVNFFAQTETLSKDDLSKEVQPLKTTIQFLQKENLKLKNEIRVLNVKLSNVNESIDSLKTLIKENKTVISKTASELGIKISATENFATQKISDVDKSIRKNSLYGIIGILSAFFLSGLLFWLLSKRQKIDKTEFIAQLQRTKSTIEESLVKEFSKQTELMSTQIQLLEKQNNNPPTLPNSEIDHSLALKVASEINIIERNLALMDNNVKGYKQLKKSVEKLKDNLNANGYEIIDLLGKPYHPGLPVTIINSFPDETLEKDMEIISKILIPAVRYKDKIIQSAQVEVNVGV